RATNDLSKLPSGMETDGLSDLKLAGCERSEEDIDRQMAG
ncbi:hypothetical protein PSYMO_37042, partial [Pseudomonas amygdali pv. mori str. 301020]